MRRIVIRPELVAVERTRYGSLRIPKPQRTVMLRRACNGIAVVLALAIGGCQHAPGQKPSHLATQTWKSRSMPLDTWTSVEDEKDMGMMLAPSDSAHPAGDASLVKALFRGKDRSEPKTSVADAALETFSSISDLESTLPPDEAMLNHDPQITRGTMDRAVEEQRNVRVVAWIYAIKYESDQDWHIIAGTDPRTGGPRYLNTEVSGLPARASPFRDTLLTVREELIQILGGDLPGPSSYRKFDEPIPVKIDGSLFYDVDHKPGAVGPVDMKPTSAWEIHPITNLVIQ